MRPYNPLDKKNLGLSAANQLLSRPVEPLAPATPFEGAGVYAIYYTGEHTPYSLYEALATHGQEPENAVPIYVGKAIPAGGRVGGLGGASPGSVLHGRLREHAETIAQAQNLDSRDFHCRYLTVDDIWIPLTENVLIDRFAPIWNTTVTGFGIHNPGSGRGGQKRSLWDTLHPGRTFAVGLPPSKSSEQDIIAMVQAALEKRRAREQTNEGDQEAQA